MNCSVCRFIVFVLILLSCKIYAQIPSGYYNSAEGLSGEPLKSALHNIIKGHIEFPYSSTATDVWDILKETDKDTANPNNVILFYSGWSVNAAQEYNSGNGWTREHVWAKSHGDFGTTKGAGTDIHHLKPADVSINSARNNKDFDSGGELYIDGDGTTECKSDEDSWEPRDIVKGDVARMLFYMATRYEGEEGEPDLELVDDVNTVNLNELSKGFIGKLSTLILWNEVDPVDSFEIHRNDIIYNYQHNRNPFIDHPEFVNKIWGDSNLQDNNIKIYLDLAGENIMIEIESEDLAEGKLYSIDGKVLLNFEITGKLKMAAGNINPGVYFLRVVNKNTTAIQKFVILNQET